MLSEEEEEGEEEERAAEKGNWPGDLFKAGRVLEGFNMSVSDTSYVDSK